MRTDKSIKNIYMNLLSQLVLILLGFISRKIFLDSLGTAYLGVNGLLTNVLSMLSLVEGGIGISIVYQLYEPLAKKDQVKIIALIQLYKKVYTFLAIIIFGISIIIYPFIISTIEKSSQIPYVGIVYSIFVIKNVISYLNAHKWSLVNADQKGYILTKYNIYFNVIITFLKIIILKITNSYILFLSIEILVLIIQNIFSGYVVTTNYPYLKTTKKYLVDLETKNSISRNIRSIFLHKFASYIVNGTDNILISIFININKVGLYSNYTMITGQLSALLSAILGAAGASVGNLIVCEEKDKVYDIFNKFYFLNFWIYSIAVIFLYNLLEEFIEWWIGNEFLLDRFTFIILLVNFYLMGMRYCVLIFKERGGIFSQDKYIPLIESLVNLLASIYLVKYIGLAGIFLGTTISTLMTAFWIQPSLIYKFLFNKPAKIYFEKYIIYLLIMIGSASITTYICDFLFLEVGLISLISKGILCIIIPNIIYVLCFHRTKEFKYIISIFQLRLYKLLRKNIFLKLSK